MSARRCPVVAPFIVRISPAVVLGLVLATLGTLVPTGSVASSAAPRRHGPGTVAIRQPFADPSFLQVGRRYVAFATGTDRHGRPFRVATAPSLRGPWHVVGAAMHRRPAWVVHSRRREVDWWAPSVIRVRPSRYVMYYTATRASTGRNCLGVAVSRTPTGPYRSTRRPFLCVPGAKEVIDPFPVRQNGRGAVAFKVNFGHRIEIRLARTWRSWLRPVGRGRVLVTRRSNIEAPALVKRHRSYYLFASTGSYTNCTYRTEVFRSSRLFSHHWHRVSTLMRTRQGGRCGPGGAEFRRIGRVVAGVFHAWLCPFTGSCRRGSTHDRHRYRGMIVARLVWRRGVPHVR